MSEAPQSNPEGPASASIGSPFVELQSVDSTNNYARELIHANNLPDRQFGALHGMAVFAHEQVAGRGQRGRSWASEKGRNIALSLLLQPIFIPPTRQFELSASVALAVHDALSIYLPEYLSIKWPNDIYWQDKKAGGILIESVIRSQEGGQAVWEWAIVGIGINVNQSNFPDNLPNPVSIKQITGKVSNPVEIARLICERIDIRYQELITEGFEKILQSYNKVLYKKDQLAMLRKENRIFSATIKGVNKAGLLMFHHGTDEVLGYGEVEWVLNQDSV